MNQQQLNLFYEILSTKNSWGKNEIRQVLLEIIAGIRTSVWAPKGVLFLEKSMGSYAYYTFMPTGEFWVAPRSVEKLREIGTIVLDPDISWGKSFLWDGKEWKTNSTKDLPALIKAFLLIYSVPDDLKELIRQDLDYEPIYLCNWR